MGNKQVGFFGLIAICVSAMVGGGVFNLPQNMAAVAGPVAQMIAWTITGVGMLCLAQTFKALTALKPNLKNGLYAYARAGFGRTLGFFVAYSYVIYNTFTCVAYAVMICSALNFFLPEPFFGTGNNWLAVGVSSLVCWAIFFLMLRGVKTSSTINLVATVAKLVPVLFFIGAAIVLFSAPAFVANVQAPEQRDLMGQVGATMPITMFAFLGIEGAVVISASARSQKLVGRATIVGFVLVLALYVATSLLPFGASSLASLQAFSTPSTATFLAEHNIGVGAALMCAGVIISALAAWFVFTLMLTQMPYSAAKDSIFPSVFAKTNEREVSVSSCLLEAVLCQVLIVVAHFLSGAIWTQLISVAAILAMPCYALSCLYLLKVMHAEKRKWLAVIGFVGAAFCMYAFFSSGLTLLLTALGIYALGGVLCALQLRHKQHNKDND